MAAVTPDDPDVGDSKLLERDVFHWVKEPERKHHDGKDVVKNAKKHARVSMHDLAVKHGIPAENVVAYIKNEMDSEASCRTLPFALLLVLSYAGMVIMHDDAPRVNAVEDSLAHNVVNQADFSITNDFPNEGMKAFWDVNSISDFWSWMNSGYIPMVFDQETDWAVPPDSNESFVLSATSTMPRSERGVLLNYNRIVLGVRVQQERFDEKVECVGGDRMKLFYNKECVGGQGYELQPEMYQARRTVDPQKIQFLHIHDDIDAVLTKVAEMDKEHWADERTKKIEVSIAVYSGEFGLHTMLMCDFFFSRGGRVWKEIIPMSVFANWHPSLRYFVFDGMWVMCVFKMLIAEVYGLGKGVMRFGWVWVAKDYLTFYKLVDYVGIMCGLGIMSMFLSNKFLTDDLNVKLAELGAVNEFTDQALYREKGEAYWTALEASIHYLNYFKMVLASYPLVVVMKLFKAFNAQPRLAVVTRTLTESVVDLSHFLLIFLSVFLTYAVAGVVLFGRETKSFTTLFRSVNTCFRMLQGDFDWSEMRLVGRLDASVWFIPFVIIIMMVLLNMLIAIIMDTYAEVASQVSGAEALWTQAGKVAMRMYDQRRGKVVELSIVKNQISDWILDEKKRLKAAASADFEPGAEGNDDGGDAPTKSVNTSFEEPAAGDLAHLHLVTSVVLKKIIPQMKKQQRIDLLQSTINKYYETHKESTDTDQLVHMIEKIDHRTRKLKRLQREKIKSAGRACDNLQEVEEITEECRTQICSAREVMQGWIPDDPADKPLPDKWLIRKPDPVFQKVDLQERPDVEEPPGDGSKTTASDGVERQLAQMEHEAAMGRKTVAEALQTVSDLHRRLLRTKEERRTDVDKFTHMKERAVLLAQENRAQRERLQQSQVTLQVHAGDRDEYFEDVKALSDENRELEKQLKLQRAIAASEKNGKQRQVLV